MKKAQGNDLLFIETNSEMTMKGEEMNNCELIRSIPATFYSASLYKDVAERWENECFRLLFLLLAMCLIPISVSGGFGLWKLNKAATQIIAQLPKIEIRNGQVSTNATEPITIRLEADNKTVPVGIIDITGNVKNLDNTEAKFLLTKTQFLYKKNEAERRSYDLSKVDQFQIDQQKATQWFHVFLISSLALVYPIILISAFIYRIIQSGFYALLGLIFNALLKANLTYFQLFKISMVAITPAIVVNVVFWTLEKMDFQVPMAGLILFLIAMWHLVFGIKAARTNGMLV